MNKRKSFAKSWSRNVTTDSKNLLTDSYKKEIEEAFSDLIDYFKREYILEKPDLRFTYTIDIYSKWHRGYFYLCQKNKSDYANRIVDEYESKFARLTFVSKDNFELSYFRHTGQWWLINNNLTLEQCKQMIIENQVLHPI